MNALYDIINILPISLLSVMLLGEYAGIPRRSILGGIVCLLFTVWIILLRHMKMKNRFRSIGIVAVFLAGLNLAAGEEYRELFFKEYFWIVWVLCFSAASLIVGVLMNRNIWIRRAAAALLLGYAITSAILDTKLGKTAFALICFVLLVRLSEEIQRKWSKSGNTEMREHTTRISPFFLMICILVYTLPAPDKPYGWQFAKSIYSNTVSLFNRIYGLITHPSDDYGNIGFSDEGGFLSGLGNTDEEVLSIVTNSSKIDEYRLVGCVSGEFGKCEWIFDTESKGFERMTDTIETSAAVRSFSNSYRADYLEAVELNCETLFYNTKYIFSPAKIRIQSTRDINSGMTDMNGSIVSDKKLQYQDKYRISCFMLNYGNPRLEEFLVNAKPVTREEWDQTASAEGVSGKAGYTYEDYLNYREEVYKKYCHARGTSEQVEKIIGEIKSGTSNRYETAKKLEAYLNSMEYSRDCGALPDSVTDAESFLDHFLLTSRKGYCMHFATAFVLMANEMGIPCRYVQGYKSERNSDGTITVKQSNAHAWPEVYFDNVGWVAFEPTPGFSVSAGWEVREKSLSDYKPYIPYPEYIPESPEAIVSPDGEEDQSKEISPLLFIIPSLAVVSFLLMFFMISRSITRRKYRKMTCGEKFKYIARQNIRYIGFLGIRMRGDETLSEYMNRIIGSENEELKEHLSFIPLYESVLYSDREITDAETAAAENTSQSLLRLVKKRDLRLRLMLLLKNQ